MVDNVSYSFPSITVSEKEKNEEWYKKYTQAIVNRSIAEGYADRYALANECVNFYLGLQTGKEFEFLQTAEDGDVLPAMWMNYNRINTKINIMLGELSQKKYEISVQGLNKELHSRKLKEKERLRIDLRFQPVAADLEAQTGMPLQGPPQAANGFVPETEQDLDDFFEKEYKDIAEIVIAGILKYLAKLNKWDYQRLQMFLDMLIMGMSFCKTEIIDGIPRSKRVDPRNMIWDINATDDFLSDATYFGELEYMSIGDAIDQYGLTKKEIEEVYASYKEYLSGVSNRFTSQYDFGVLNQNRSLRFFKSEGGDLRVLVCRATWVDYKPFKNKISNDKYGQTHIKRMDPDSNEKDVKHDVVKIWRQGTLIGGKFLKNWGETPNQARDWTNLSNCEAPYKALIPQYMNGVAVSKVQMMMNLQKLKDMALYRLQLDMARAGAKGFFYDINQLPAGFKIEQVLKYLKTTGIVLIDSASGNPTGFNQFKEVDLTISNNITAYLEISAMVDREMDAISGINEARQGMVKNASQAVGVTQSSLFQSALATSVYYDLFAQYCSNILNYQAKLAKIAWAGKERFAPVIGDSGIDFLTNDVDMDLHDYAVFVEEIPPMLQEQQTYQQMIIAAVQAQQLSFVQAMNLLLEKDVRVGVRKLERENKKMMEQQQAQQEALMQQEQENMVAQQEQAKADRDAMIAEKSAGYQNEMAKVLAQGKIGMKGQLIDFKKDVILARMQKDLEKAKMAQQAESDDKKLAAAKAKANKPKPKAKK